MLIMLLTGIQLFVFRTIHCQRMVVRSVRITRTLDLEQHWHSQDRRPARTTGSDGGRGGVI